MAIRSQALLAFRCGRIASPTAAERAARFTHLGFSLLPPRARRSRVAGGGGGGGGGGGWGGGVGVEVADGDEDDAAVGPGHPSTPAPDCRRSASGKRSPPRSGFARVGP